MISHAIECYQLEFLGNARSRMRHQHNFKMSDSKRDPSTNFIGERVVNRIVNNNNGSGTTFTSNRPLIQVKPTATSTTAHCTNISHIIRSKGIRNTICAINKQCSGNT